MLFSNEKYNFFNPEILGFGLCQSRDSGLRKTSGIPVFGIPGLQSIIVANYALRRTRARKLLRRFPASAEDFIFFTYELV